MLSPFEIVPAVIAVIGLALFAISGCWKNKDPRSSTERATSKEQFPHPSRNHGPSPIPMDKTQEAPTPRKVVVVVEEVPVAERQKTVNESERELRLRTVSKKESKAKAKCSGTTLAVDRTQGSVAPTPKVSKVAVLSQKENDSKSDASSKKSELSVMSTQEQP